MDLIFIIEIFLLIMLGRVCYSYYFTKKRIEPDPPMTRVKGRSIFGPKDILFSTELRPENRPAFGCYTDESESGGDRDTTDSGNERDDDQNLDSDYYGTVLGRYSRWPSKSDILTTEGGAAKLNESKSEVTADLEEARGSAAEAAPGLPFDLDFAEAGRRAVEEARGEAVDSGAARSSAVDRESANTESTEPWIELPARPTGGPRIDPPVTLGDRGAAAASGGETPPSERLRGTRSGPLGTYDAKLQAEVEKDRPTQRPVGKGWFENLGKNFIPLFSGYPDSFDPLDRQDRPALRVDTSNQRSYSRYKKKY